MSRKITQAVALIHCGRHHVAELGNLDARRDWGHASDYVKGMYMMLQQPQPDDYVLASGKTFSVRQLAEVAFKVIGITLRLVPEIISVNAR